MRWKPRDPFFKYCSMCGKRYQPKGRFYQYCDDCKATRKEEFIKIRILRRDNGRRV